jgi:hypothetical protein
MKLAVSFCVFVSFISSTVLAGSSGLLAHWDFNEGTGDVLHDRSGSGIDGAITGATWTKGHVDGALQFDGVDDLVTLKQDDRLNLDGDATLSAWFRTLPTKDLARDQLLFGDGASRTILRNLSVVIDQGKLTISNGNGVTADTISPTTEFAGDWTHLAIVYEFPAAFCYINGRLVEVREMSVPLTATKGAGWFIGGWWAGHLKGEIDDMKIYARALSENEVLAEFDSNAPAAAPVGSITPRLSISQKKVDLAVSCRNLSDAQLKQAKAWIEVFKPGDLPGKRAAFLRKPVSLIATRAGSQRYAASVAVDLASQLPGEYDARLVLENAGKPPAVLGDAKIYFDKTPAWWGNRIGITNQIPPPFTPVSIKPDGKSYGVSVTQREYRVDPAHLLADVVAGGQSLLAGPARLLARVDDRSVEWRASDISVQSAAPDSVTYSHSLAGGGLRIAAQSNVEYDGFVKMQLEVRSSSPVSIDELALEIPLKASTAKYLYAWADNVKASGALKEKTELSFSPILWMGNDVHGLSWFCESDQNWKLKQDTDAIRIEPSGEQVVVRINLVSRPTRLAADRPLKYTFAFQATPLRPREKDCWEYRITSTPDYGFDYDLLTKDLQGKPSGEWLKEHGFRTLLACNWTDVLAYPWPIGKEKLFKDLVTLCHRNGMKIIPYLGYQINTLAPEFRALRDEVVRLPLMQNPDKYPGMTKSQTVATVTLSSVWQDALVFYVDKLMREYDVDGIYLDSTCMPFGSTNQLAGDGYVDDTGKLKATYPVFAVRETYKRLYNVVKKHKPDGYVDTHVYDCMNASALAFSTSFWNGEQLSASADDVTQSLPVDRFRAEMMGFNWGVPADFLYYKLGDFKKAHAISLIHDVGVRSNVLAQKELNAEIWKLFDAFGRNEASFIPYWDAGDKVHASPEGAYASIYTHPKNGVLVIASNLKPARTTVEVQVKLERASWRASDGLTGSAVPFADGKLTLELEPMGWQFIWLKPE